MHDSTNHFKRAIAQNILADSPKIPAQVVSEYLNITKRLLNLSKSILLEQCAALFKDCEIIPTKVSTLSFAASLVSKYDFQIFDAIIVAASIESGCTFLYSEDMQHNLHINNTLTIINPFLY
jgi:predicted nucleic acid-binding protein